MDVCQKTMYLKYLTIITTFDLLHFSNSLPIVYLILSFSLTQRLILTINPFNQMMMMMKITF